MPATHPDRVLKALAAGADEVVVDLEDAVPVAEKDAARTALLDIDWSSAVPDGVGLAVRVNAVGSPWCHRDLELVAGGGVPATTVVLPKVESRTDVAFAERLLAVAPVDGSRRRVGVQALIETASGLAALDEIVSRPDRLEALILGYADLGASLGRRGHVAADWVPAQHAVLVAARVAGIDAVDGPHLGLDVDQSFLAAVDHAARFGFDGKWVIHPRQVDAVVDGFTPSEQEVQRAQRVLEALEHAAGERRGAVQVDGQLVDEAMAVAARRVLARSGR